MAVIRELVSINMELVTSGSEMAKVVGSTATVSYTTCMSGSSGYSKHGNVTLSISGSMDLDGLANMAVDAVNSKEDVS